MTNEEMQSTMEFILAQQAQYTARIQRDDSRLTRLEDAFVTLVELAKLADERIDGLAKTDEEMQRTMEFILEQQAQYAARMQRDESRLTRLEDGFVTLVQVAKLTDGRNDGLAESMTLLAQSQARNDAGLAELRQKMTELAGAQVHADERLSALIDIVDRYIARGSNGNAGD